uniref:Uncharacterized protein n=1 Tax=Corethron hystrix TaxID=216773 RepID=A0A7S1B3Y6_9STRA|mmetsp:Transcript_121/g.265  ORF Transcript_121/g.265 Transcript_121/m.265 type:complete len:149 (+) Transcript_121:153-599(+)
MDNLYISEKMLLFVFMLCKHLVHRVCQVEGQEVPSVLLQELKTKIEEVFCNRGTLKCAALDGAQKMISIVSSLLYNMKHFYMMSMVYSEVKWKKLYRIVFDKLSHKKIEVLFCHLNFTDEYNAKMGKVNIGDQLQNYYCFDHWMKKRK